MLDKDQVREANKLNNASSQDKRQIYKRISKEQKNEPSAVTRHALE